MDAILTFLTLSGLSFLLHKFVIRKPSPTPLEEPVKVPVEAPADNLKERT